MTSEEPQYIRVNRNEYQIVQKSGEGGFSFVYRVTDSSGQTFALKRILLVDSKARENAQREVDFLKQLPRHRAIVELVASEINSKEALLLFEFCGGGSVYQLIERRLEQRRPLGEDEIWAIYHACCEAIEHCHSQDPPVQHRDIKVENLLLAKRGIVLCDFGSATTHVWDTKNGQNRRMAEEDINNNTTMSYRSPEMADLYGGNRITEKSDIWALGVLLYRLSYFEAPWEPDSSLAILNCKYSIPHQRYSAAVPALIKQLLVLDPNRRPDIYGVLDGVLQVRGKTMSSTMMRRRDDYRARVNRGPVAAASSDSGRSSRAAPAKTSAVKVDGGFVAASLFDSLDWQEVSPKPPHEQQQRPASSHQRQLSGGNSFEANFGGQQQSHQQSQPAQQNISFEQAFGNQQATAPQQQQLHQRQLSGSHSFEQAFGGQAQQQMPQPSHHQRQPSGTGMMPQQTQPPPPQHQRQPSSGQPQQQFQQPLQHQRQPSGNNTPSYVSQSSGQQSALFDQAFGSNSSQSSYQPSPYGSQSHQFSQPSYGSTGGQQSLLSGSRGSANASPSPPPAQQTFGNFNAPAPQAQAFFTDFPQQPQQQQQQPQPQVAFPTLHQMPSSQSQGPPSGNLF